MQYYSHSFRKGKHKFNTNDNYIKFPQKRKSEENAKKKQISKNQKFNQELFKFKKITLYNYIPVGFKNN